MSLLVIFSLLFLYRLVTGCYAVAYCGGTQLAFCETWGYCENAHCSAIDCIAARCQCDGDWITAICDPGGCPQ